LYLGLYHIFNYLFFFAEINKFHKFSLCKLWSPKANYLKSIHKVRDHKWQTFQLFSLRYYSPWYWQNKRRKQNFTGFCSIYLVLLMQIIWNLFRNVFDYNTQVACKFGFHALTLVSLGQMFWDFFCHSTHAKLEFDRYSFHYKIKKFWIDQLLC
jgi:hypothetical protein